MKEILFCTLWIVATLALGGVAAPYERIHILAAALLSSWILYSGWRQSLQERLPAMNHSKISLIVISLLLAWVLFQLIPFPSPLLKLLAPLSYHLTFGTLTDLQIDAHHLRFPISLDPPVTLAAFGQLSVFFLMLGAAIVVLADLNARLFVLKVIAGISAGVAFFGLAHRFSGSQKMFWFLDRGWTFFGPYVNTNHAGGLFAVGAAVTLGLLSQKLKRTDQGIVLSALGMSCLGLCFTGSRTAVLALSLTLIIYFLTERNRNRHVKVYTLSMMGLVLATAVLWKATFIGRLLSTSSAWAAGREFRISFWTYAYNLWSRSPLAGIGLGAFSKISPIAIGDSVWVHPEHVENDYLELFVCLGFVGALCAGFLGYRLVKRINHLLRKRDVAPPAKAYALGATAFLIHSVFVFNAPLPAHQILFALLLGGVFTSHRSSLLGHAWLRRGLAGLGVVCFVFGISTLWNSNKGIPADFQMPLLVGDAGEGSEANQQAAKLVFEAQRSEAESVLRTDPLHSDALFRFALASAELKEMGRAELASQAAFKLNPFDLYHRVLLARALGNSRPSQTLEWIEKILKATTPTTGSVRLGLHIDAALLATQLGLVPSARDHLEAAKILSPQDWRIPLVVMLQESEPASLIAQSWKEAQSAKVPDVVWDQFLFARLRERKISYSAEEIARSVASSRTDLGSFLQQLGARIVLRLDAADGSVPLKPNNPGSSVNGTWESGLLRVKVLRAQPDVDAYLLPLNLELKPPSLSFRMVVECKHALSRQMVVEVNGKLFLTREAAKRLAGNQWELRFSNVGEIVRNDSDQPLQITGVGFTPLEKDGEYRIGPIEVFVNSEPSGTMAPDRE